MIRKLVHYARQDGGLGTSSLQLAGGTLFAQFVSLLSTPILTHLFTPTEYGVYAVYASLLTILLVVGSLKYETAIPLPERDEDAGMLVALSVLLLAIFTTAIFIITSLFGVQVAVALKFKSGVSNFFWVLPVGVFGGGVYQILSNWATRKSKFYKMAQTRLVQATVKSVTQIGIGISGLHPYGLLLGDAFGRAGGVSFLVPLVEWRHVLPTRVSRLWRAAKSFSNFPLVLSWSSVLNVSSIQLPTVLLSYFFGPSTSGAFSLSFAVLGQFVNLVGQAVGQPLFKMCVQNRHDYQKIGLVAKKTAVFIFAVSFPIFIILFIVGERLFAQLFGPSWHLAGIDSQLLAPWYAVWIVSSPLSIILIALEKQKTYALLTVLEVSLRLLAIIVGGELHLQFISITLYSISGVAIALVNLSVFMKAANSSLLDIAKSIRKLVIVGVLVAIPIYVLQLFPHCEILLIPAVLLSIILYYFLLIRFKWVNGRSTLVTITDA